MNLKAHPLLFLFLLGCSSPSSIITIWRERTHIDLGLLNMEDAAQLCVLSNSTETGFLIFLSRCLHVIILLYKMLCYLSALSPGLRIHWLYPWHRSKTHPLKRGVLSMRINCIWWCSSSSRDLRSVECPFYSITPRSTLTWSGSSSLCPIYESNKSVKKICSYSINLKKPLKKQLHQECRCEHTINTIS